MRTDSIYSRLQRSDDKSGTTYFLDLMIFLEEAEKDKFGQGVKLVEHWGYKTSKTALCEGYDESVSLWRLGRARAFAASTQTLSTFDAETKQVIGQQTFQVVANPNLEPKILLGFAKLEVEKLKAEATLRRVALLEKQNSKAKETLAEVAMTPEEKLARINQIFGKAA